jgi:hypothetical protein
MEMINFTIPTLLGTEKCVSNEVIKLGYDVTSVTDGRVNFQGDLEAICLGNINLRSAERILIHMGDFKATSFEELFEGVQNIPWEKYIGKDKIDEELTKLQRAAIKKANGVKPIKLTPDMIVTKTMGNPRRSPLGLAPSIKKALVFSGKFSTTALTSLLTIWIALDVIMNPDWNVLVMALLRILTVVLNGFSGWQFGYDNVVVDRVNYLSDKCDLMEQALRFEIK